MDGGASPKARHRVACEVKQQLAGVVIVLMLQVAAIASQLPDLAVLHLNGNGLRPLDEQQLAAFPP